MPLCKSDIRKCMLEQRKALTAAEVRDKSVRILQGLALLHSFREARFVMCYMDFRNEVMTSGILEYCLKQGKHLAIPRTVVMPDGEPGLLVYEITDPANEVYTGKYGILEPDAGKTRQVSPREIDIVLVPGVAYDTGRHRIGYGAGYYDRFLRTVRPDCFKAGLAFEIQMADDIPADEFDMQMDAVITESRIIF